MVLFSPETSTITVFITIFSVKKKKKKRYFIDIYVLFNILCMLKKYILNFSKYMNIEINF